MGINFWKKESGNLLSHGQGLTKEQVQFLQSLKEGVRLILWKAQQNDRADVCLKKYNPKPRETP